VRHKKVNSKFNNLTHTDRSEMSTLLRNRIYLVRIVITQECITFTIEWKENNYIFENFKL